ncbi:MAG TPA: cytochrome c oxidase assembly protein [Candidatus Dormibacteraeota bacterium]|nr:cytochrome c oxidase assembly protein [Candidatus Dormibacteraeota bacterium]
MTSWLHWLGLWEFNPAVWVVCGLAVLLYLRFPGAKRDGRAAAWVVGVLVTLISLESALDVAGQRYLFSVHMAQHLLLAMVAPPLLIRGLPEPTVDWLLRSRAAPILRTLVQPLLAASAYFAILVLWHVPALLDYSLTHSAWYLVQHLSFLAVGLIFWWAVVIHRDGERWNLSPLGEVAYLTCGALPSVVVGLTLALLPKAIYTEYLVRSALLGVSAVGDQHLGGLLMFAFDNTLMVGVAGYYFWRLFPADQSDERRNTITQS